MQNLETIIARLKGYFSFNGYLVPQAEAEQTIREGVSFRGTNILILVFAILIASLGLNTNSTAVITRVRDNTRPNGWSANGHRLSGDPTGRLIV